ncbi:MAG TPA: SDR family NAD(P)-dependent oxidoreductase [Steroidobacteraceae bacterium]|nr:SDR family NAD(P)-dependent oxidoreductase [Steroidobacteraceae bacterium]
MTSTVKGKAVAITGAFGALGAATALLAAEQGARLALIDRAPHAPAGLFDAPSGEIHLVTGVNLTDETQATAAVRAAHEQLQGLDVLINVAGAFRWQTVADGDPAIWDQLFAVNLKSALFTSRAAIPFLRQSRQGRIINIGANAALKAGAGMGAYTASKSGLHRLTESLAEELKSVGITVNAVLPSIIDTPANRVDMPKADFTTWVTPRALAEVILFLASDAGAPVTGALLPVTGRV